MVGEDQALRCQAPLNDAMHNIEAGDGTDSC